MENVCVLGAGSGTALRQGARRQGRATKIWAHEPSVATAINETHENARLEGRASSEPGRDA
ncbi:MAG: hypothetical protein U0414_20775 [Polyangiaceae bacterium]